MTSSSSSGLKVVAFGVIPFVVGILLKLYVIPESVFQGHVEPLIPEWTVRLLTADSGSNDTESDENIIPVMCHVRFQKMLDNTLDKSVWDDMSLFLHRNGEATSCGEAGSGRSFVQVLEETYASTYSDCPAFLDKYQVEALLTQTLHQLVNSCISLESDGNKKAGLLGFCDMGESKTPILLDHQDLVPVTSPKTGKTSLPCRLHTREGLRISQLNQLLNVLPPPCSQEGGGSEQTCSATLANEVHLYAVPAGRVFMFAPAYVGEIFDLPHVEGSDEKPISLEVLSLSPRVFDVFNFFSKEESRQIVEGAKAEGRESYRIKRSTTGASSHSINSRRTSESGFDTHGKTSVKVKKRCFAALGFDEYLESHGDGLQILRYNLTTAYNTHLDFFEDKTGRLEHDYDSAHKGGNRFATILMYMSDLGPDDGGETVFPEGWPPHLPEADRVSPKVALQELRESPRGDVLQHGSWEEDLVAKCRTRLAIRPHSARAVLFYSQFPNGELDPASLHGACPILSGQKYAANLWVWNTPRQGYPGAPMNEKLLKQKKTQNTASTPLVNHAQITATFRNSGNDPAMASAELYYENQFWGKLGSNDPDLGANTFQGHVWNVRVNGKVVKTWKISSQNGAQQEFTI